MESLAGPRLVSATARRHGISRSLLLTWRRAFQGARSETASVSGFVPAVIVPEAGATKEPERRAVGRIVIVLGRGRRILVDARVDADALGRVLDVLERR